jgi:hypothetical protein
MIKVYKVWGIKRLHSGAPIRAVVLADSVAEALDRIRLVGAVDATDAHTDESHSLDLEKAPHWILIEDECSYSACQTQAVPTTPATLEPDAAPPAPTRARTSRVSRAAVKKRK